MSAYTYAENIRNTLLNNLSQFQYDDAGSNIGVGYTGWDDALSYARDNNLDYFGSVFPAMGDDDTPKAFQYGMWRWSYYIRTHVKFDITSDPTPDEMITELADDIFSVLINSANIQSIAPGGVVKVMAVNYMGEPETINDVHYLLLEFLVSVKVQISRE